MYVLSLLARNKGGFIGFITSCQDSLYAKSPSVMSLFFLSLPLCLYPTTTVVLKATKPLVGPCVLFTLGKIATTSLHHQLTGLYRRASGSVGSQAEGQCQHANVSAVASLPPSRLDWFGSAQFVALWSLKRLFLRFHCQVLSCFFGTL